MSDLVPEADLLALLAPLTPEQEAQLAALTWPDAVSLPVGPPEPMRPASAASARPRVPCTAITAQGLPCRCFAVHGDVLCSNHGGWRAARPTRYRVSRARVGLDEAQRRAREALIAVLEAGFRKATVAPDRGGYPLLAGDEGGPAGESAGQGGEGG